MSAILLDGKALAQKLLVELKAEVEGLRVRTGKIPRFHNITIGHDPGAGSYGKSQKRAADSLGILVIASSRNPPNSSCAK